MARTLRPSPGRSPGTMLPALAALALFLGTAVAAVPAVAAIAAAAAIAEVPASAAADAVPVPENIVAHHIPPIPRGDAEELQPYENMRSASFADWHPRERRMLILTRFAQTQQLQRAGHALSVRAARSPSSSSR